MVISLRKVKKFSSRDKADYIMEIINKGRM